MIEYVPKYRDEAEAVADMKEHWHAQCRRWRKRRDAKVCSPLRHQHGERQGGNTRLVTEGSGREQSTLGCARAHFPQSLATAAIHTGAAGRLDGGRAR